VTTKKVTFLGEEKCTPEKILATPLPQSDTAAPQQGSGPKY